MRESRSRVDSYGVGLYDMIYTLGLLISANVLSCKVLVVLELNSVVLHPSYTKSGHHNS